MPALQRTSHRRAETLGRAVHPGDEEEGEDGGGAGDRGPVPPERKYRPLERQEGSDRPRRKGRRAGGRIPDPRNPLRGGRLLPGDPEGGA